MFPSQYTLLTGATGLLGRHILTDLSRARMPVAVLVRGTAQSAAARIDALLKEMEVRHNRSYLRPVVLEGELTQPDLGLSSDQESWIAEHCPRIIHSAASLTFRPARSREDDPYRTNVGGTRNLLSFCNRIGLREWHYISTAYVCGMRSGLVTEREGHQGQDFSNDYEQSKLAAEEMLHQATGIRSLTIYRPSIVIDPVSESQTADRTLYHAFATYRLLCQQIGIPPRGSWLSYLGLTGHERKNVVIADWVARMIVQIVRHPDLYDQTYHLTSRQGITVTEIEQGFESTLQSDPTLHPATSNSLPESIAQLAAPFVSTFGSYFRDDPQFDLSHLSLALSRCGEVHCPETNAREIEELCRRQNAALPQTPTTTIEHRQLLARLHAAAIWAPLPPSAERPVGIFATGPGGGAWILDRDLTGDMIIRVGNAEGAPLRLYAQSTTWEALLRGTLQTPDACQTGQLLVESDQDNATGHQAAEVVAALQSRLGLNGRRGHWDRSEVVHVR